MPRGIPNSSQQGNTATLTRQKGQAQQGAQQGITQQQRTGQMGGTQQSGNFQLRQYQRNCQEAITWMLEHYNDPQQGQSAVTQFLQTVHS